MSAPYLVLRVRLVECVHPFFGWVTRDEAMRHKPQAKYLHERAHVDRAWHVGRVRYFMERIDSGWKLDPIEVESRVFWRHMSSMPVWCGPKITDGQHRFAAAAICGLQTIPATFDGVITTINWLTGQRKRRPPELRL